MEQIQQARGGGIAKEQAIGQGQEAVFGPPRIDYIVGKAVNPLPALAGRRLAVQAVKQAAVDKGRPAEQFQQALRSGDFGGVAVAGKVAVGGLPAAAELPPLNFGVQGGEKQVLQDSPIVGIAAFPVVIFEQPPNLMLDEQLLGRQSLLFDEPAEQHPGNQSDDLLLRGQAGRKAGRLHRPLEPGEQVPIETAVQLLGIQGIQPGGQQAVEVGGMAVTFQPAPPFRQG